MIDALIPYLADSFPGLLVAFIMGFYVVRRMAQLESRICTMLEKCMSALIDEMRE